MADSFEVANGDGTLRVVGMRKTLGALEKAGADAGDMRELMQAIGNIVARAADAPSRTGRLADTIRAGRGKTKAVVRAGGAKAPYAGVTHYGSPHTGQAAQPFLTDALRAKRSEVFRTLDGGIAEILRHNKLT